MQVLRLLCLVVLISASSSRVWESKESSSGVRGRGQITPKVFDVSVPKGRRTLDKELVDVASHLTSSQSESRHKRQTEVNNIGYTSRLGNDSHLQAVVHWTGHPSQFLFIVTRKPNGSHSDESWLWRSTDLGHTFVNETYKLVKAGNPRPVVEWYYISPYSEYLIFADIKNRRLYITTDEGETYLSQPIPFKADHLQFQNKLAPNSTTTYSKYVLGYDANAKTLWASTDLGVSWNNIGNNVPADGYYWRRLDTDVEGDLSKVYLEMKIDANSNNSMLFVAQYPYHGDSQLFSPSLGQFQSDSFVLEYEYIFVQHRKRRLTTLDSVIKKQRKS